MTAGTKASLTLQYDAIETSYTPSIVAGRLRARRNFAPALFPEVPNTPDSSALATTERSVAMGADFVRADTTSIQV